jgi:hypothetical protein
MYTLLLHGFLFQDINTQLSYCNKFQRIHKYVLCPYIIPLWFHKDDIGPHRNLLLWSEHL